MQVVIEFYRIRDADGAHAVVGRETADVIDLHEAIGIAHRLWQSPDMPQQPDAVTISDHKGSKLYSGAIEREAGSPASSSST